MMQTAERVSQHDTSDNYVFRRSILAYYKAAGIISGKVLEIGTGSGYGIEVIAPKAETFITVDKAAPDGSLYSGATNVEFRLMSVPPLIGIPSESVDYVVSFQVIEHIKEDVDTIAEIYRVLQPGGRLIISTPNKSMSLTRNPWHVREYTPQSFCKLLGCSFDKKKIETLGVFGNEKVMEYYSRNKESVRSVMKYDIFNLQYRLPRWILKIPYDIMNRRNRKKLLKENSSLTSSISMEDYFFAPVDENCFDLYYIAEK